MIEIPEDALGKELILDIHGCDISTFVRESLENFCLELCKEIDMTPVQRHVWEYLEDPSRDDFEHFEGHSICQSGERI